MVGLRSTINQLDQIYVYRIVCLVTIEYTFFSHEIFINTGLYLVSLEQDLNNLKKRRNNTKAAIELH